VFNRGDHLFSATATVLVRAWSKHPEALTWVSRDGQRLQAVTPPMAVVWAVMSPDRQRAVLTVPKRNRDEKELWLLDVERGTTTPLATEAWDYGRATWSRDGTRILVTIQKTAGGPVFFIEEEAHIGGASRELLEAPPGTLNTVVLPGAQGTLFFSLRDDANQVGLRGMRIDGDRSPFVIAPNASGAAVFGRRPLARLRPAGAAHGDRRPGVQPPNRDSVRQRQLAAMEGRRTRGRVPAGRPAHGGVVGPGHRHARLAHGAVQPCDPPVLDRVHTATQPIRCLSGRHPHSPAGRRARCRAGQLRRDAELGVASRGPVTSPGVVVASRAVLRARSEAGRSQADPRQL
jgi:hypothetical protein